MTINHTTPASSGKPTFLDAKNATARPDGKPNVLRFGQGVNLWVYASGVKTWRCKVMRDGRETTVNLGTFPAVSIKQAQAARAAMKLAADPAMALRVERTRAIETSERTLRLVAERWMESRADKAGWTPLVRIAIERRLETYLLRKLGDLPIAAITADDVEGLIKSVHRKYPKTAVMLRQHLSGIFAYALRRDWCATNLVQKIAEDLPSRKRGDERPRTYVATIEDARRVLAAIESRWRAFSPFVVLAHRLIALTGVRKGEALGARWSEFDLASATWTIPAQRMKARRTHVVALSPQAIEVIEAARLIRKNEFVFPTGGSRRRGGNAPVSRHGINEVMVTSLRLAGLGQIMVPHGWRSTFSTIMNERSGAADFRVIDVMLAHRAFRDSVEARDGRKSSVEGRYNHARYRSEQHRIACEWADLLLDGAPSARALIGLDRPSSNIVTLPDRRVA